MKVKRLALTFGIVWGATLFLTTLLNLYTGYGADFLNIWVGIYPGFTVTLLGSVVGFVYGFLDMFVGVYIVVWVYRQLGKYF